MMEKTRKVMEINENGLWVVCKKEENQKYNKYRLYRKWYDNGWHYKQLAKYENFESVLWYIHSVTTKGWNENSLASTIAEYKSVI